MIDTGGLFPGGDYPFAITQGARSVKTTSAFRQLAKGAMYISILFGAWGLVDSRDADVQDAAPNTTLVTSIVSSLLLLVFVFQWKRGNVFESSSSDEDSVEMVERRLTIGQGRLARRSGAAIGDGETRDITPVNRDERIVVRRRGGREAFDYSARSGRNKDNSSTSIVNLMSLENDSPLSGYEIDSL